MNFKHLSFMFMGSMAVSAAMLLGACGDSTSSDDEESSTVSAKSSSSSKKASSSSKSKSSSSSASISDAEDPSDLAESKKLEAPTNVVSERQAPSVWDISFSYAGEDAESIVVQRIAPGGKSWEEYAELGADVTHFLVDGEDNGGYYYRLAAKNKDSRSAYTKEIFVSEENDYAEGISLDAPTAKPNVTEDNILELVITGNYPGKKITKSVYNKDSDGKVVGGVYYQARFVTGAEKGVDTVKVSSDQSSISMEYDSEEEQCNSYAQIRVVWTDRNGVSDYGEWSDPMGSKAGTNTSLVDDAGRCSAKASEEGSAEKTDKGALPVPSALSVVNQGNGDWMLEWAYASSEARPEKGFIVQKLNLEKSKWVNYDSTGAGVYRALVSGLTDTYNYFRVAAYDGDGVSKYSSDVLITVSEQEAEVSVVAPPADLGLARIAPSVWELSWTYDIATDSPDRKFIIQKSKLKDFEWTVEKDDIEGNVRYYRIDSRASIETYYRMAVVEGSDTSAFTEAVQLTPDVAYRDYMALNTPVPSMKFIKYYTTNYEVDKDTSTKADFTYVDATATFTITEDFASKYIYESEYTDSVYYEARWFTSLEHYNDYKQSCDGKKESNYCDSCYWVEAFPYEEPSISKGFYESDIYSYGEDGDKDTTMYSYCKIASGYDPDKHSVLFDPSANEDEWNAVMLSEVSMSKCLQHYVRGICGYYVQIRIVWKDKNGETDWSEWTAPLSVGDIDGASDICAE